MCKVLPALAGLILLGSLVHAGQIDTGKKLQVPDMAPIRVMDNGKELTIELKDAFKYHGHSCAGAVVAMRIMHHAVDLLWGDVVPDRKDIVILSRGRMYGVLDVFALVTKGPVEPKTDAVSQPSPVVKKMPVNRESFKFTIIRRSTGQAVDIHVNRELYPDDFFALRAKKTSGKATKSELKRLRKRRDNLIRTIPTMPAEKLFEKTARYRVLMFGA